MSIESIPLDSRPVGCDIAKWRKSGLSIIVMCPGDTCGQAVSGPCRPRQLRLFVVFADF